jgi:IS5 family transposase
VLITTGTIVDATIIHAPSWTNNREQKLDPEMRQTRKGKQWYFGMKAHVGVDSKTKLIHSAVVTPTHVADATVLPELLHGEETRVWGDQAYRGQRDVIQQCVPRAQDCTHRRYRYKDHIDEVERAKNRSKSTVRSKVEHVFGVMKLKFGFAKVRYRGLAKNANRLFATCALVNLFMVRKKLLAHGGVVSAKSVRPPERVSRRDQIACRNERTALNLPCGAIPWLMAVVVQRFLSS